MAAQPLKVPTMWIQGLWDQEDMWGAIQTYLKVEPKDSANTLNYLVMGPWRHSGVNYEGSTLGPLHLNGDTALQFRRDVLKPFFDQYLKEGAAKADTPPVFIYNTGENHWDRFPSWPLACDTCATKSRPLYLTNGFGLSFSAPAARDAMSPEGHDEYVSDPAKPVPYLPRPVRFADGALWQRWLLTDQRWVADRHRRPQLRDPAAHRAGAHRRRAGGQPGGVDQRQRQRLGGQAHRRLSRGDAQRAVDGRLPAGDRDGHLPRPLSRERGNRQAIPSNTPLPFRFILPTANHVFLPGHRIMVQVQSSWFPLYDRNPQTLRSQHLLRHAGRLRQGDPAHLPRHRGGELHRAAGEVGTPAIPAASRCGMVALAQAIGYKSAPC